MSNYTAEERKLLEPAYRARFLFIMFLVCLFDFADRSVFTVTARTIAAEFGLNDTEIGLLGGFMFAALYSFVGIPIGRLAEHKSRIRIVSVCTAIWSAATVACGMAVNFFTLALGRIGVGFGEAGFMGPANSLNSDHHAAEKRASRMSLILLGTPIGSLLGATIGGWAADPEAWGNWRYAFWILGAGGLVTAGLVLFALREPQRGLVDDLPRSPKPPPDFKTFLALVATKRALLFVIIGGSLASIGMSSISNFMAIFLERFHEMPAREAGPLFGTITAVSLTIGLLVGSWGSDFLAKRDRRWWAWGPAIGLSCAPIIYIAAFSADTRAATTALLIAAGASLLLFYGPTVAMIQNLVAPKMRATGAAFYSMLYAMIGYGVGPPLVGFTSDLVASASFTGDGAYRATCPGGIAREGAGEALMSACQTAAATGIQRALMIAVCVFFAAAVAYLIASRSLRADLFDSAKAAEDEAASAGRQAGAAKPAE
jgi:predicted MFS family arabinose efflux permease